MTKKSDVVLRRFERPKVLNDEVEILIDARFKGSHALRLGTSCVQVKSMMFSLPWLAVELSQYGEIGLLVEATMIYSRVAPGNVEQ